MRNKYKKILKSFEKFGILDIADEENNLILDIYGWKDLQSTPNTSDLANVN